MADEIKTVTFCGFGLPYLPKAEGEIWTCNNWYDRRPELNPDRIYQIHGKDELNPYIFDPKRCGDYPVVTLEPLGCKNEIRFNLHNAIDDVGVDKFTSTICYMFYDAIGDEYNKIILNGINLLSESEYQSQIKTLLWWIDLARNDYEIEVKTYYEHIWRSLRVYPSDSKIYGSKKAIEKVIGNGNK